MKFKLEVHGFGFVCLDESDSSKTSYSSDIEKAIVFDKAKDVVTTFDTLGLDRELANVWMDFGNGFVSSDAIAERGSLNEQPLTRMA